MASDEEAGVYPPPLPAPELPGITADDFAELLDHARNRRVRSFSLETTMRGVQVKLEGQFEAAEKTKGSRDER
jgi:hypothetical protein